MQHNLSLATITTTLPEDEAVVRQRVNKFLQRNLACLPKTKTSFFNSIRGLCSVKKEVVSADQIIRWLQDQCVVKIEQGAVWYNPNRFRQQVPWVGGAAVGHVFAKVQDWLCLQHDNCSLPTSERGLQNSLTQLCKVALLFPPENVLEKLVEEEYVRIEGEELRFFAKQLQDGISGNKRKTEEEKSSEKTKQDVWVCNKKGRMSEKSS